RTPPRRTGGGRARGRARGPGGWGRPPRRSPRPPLLTGVALAVQLAFAHPASSAPPLAPGTLPSLLTGGRYQGLSGVPTTTATNTGMRMDITQAAAPQGQTARAYIDWASFNIANGSMVNFNQPSSTAMILNNIFQGTPSVIQGQLQANGIVYLINQNGIVFDKGSQVNVGALVASALGLNSVNGQTFFDSASTFPTGQPVFSGYGSDPQNG